MATIGERLQASNPDLWAQLAGLAGAQGAPTPGPEAPVPAAVTAPPAPVAAVAPPMPSLEKPDVEALKEAERQASMAGHAATVLRGFREAGNLARGGRAAETDFSDLEAMRKAPLDAYNRREAARQAANRALIEQITGQHTAAQTAHIPVEEAQKAAELAETKGYHTGELGARAASTAATMRDVDVRTQQQAYDRNLQRELKARELAQDKAKWDADRASREQMLKDKLAALKNQSHNARASGLAKQAANLDAAIADTDAQYKAAKDASRGAGIASAALEHIPLVGPGIAAAVAPSATAVRGGAKAESESAATAIGGGAATAVRMNAMKPLEMDPSLSKKALGERHDIKVQRLKGRREDLQREAAALGIPLDTKHAGGGAEATHYKYNDPDPAKATLKIPTDAAGNELGPPEKNQ